MSRVLLSSTASCIRVPLPLAQARLASSSASAPSDDWSGRKCPKPKENLCEPSISNPESKPTCTTEAEPTGRSDATLDDCLKRQIANPLPICTRPYFKAFPCESSQIPQDRNKKKSFEGESAWVKIPCCTFHKCEIEPIRHDILYLQPDEKCWRRTWRDWSQVCMVDEVCEPPKYLVDDPEYRPPKIRVREIIPHCVKPDFCNERPRGQVNKAATADQPKVEPHPCPKIRLAGCKPCRPDVKCLTQIMPKCCKKRCTPYPAFSECTKKADLECPPGKPDQECGCVKNVPRCELFAHFQRAEWLKD